MNTKEIKSNITFEDEMYGQIKGKINFAKELNISTKELIEIEQIRCNYLKHVNNSPTKCNIVYETNNNVSNIFTSKLDVKEESIYILEAASVILKYLYELLPNNNTISNINFDDILNKENKTKLEENIIKLAFYLLMPVDKLCLEEENLIRDYTLNNEDISWHRKLFIYNLSKKYNLPESIIDKKLKLIAQTNNYDLNINKFLSGEQKVLYKDDNKLIDRRSLMLNIIK